MPSPPQSIEMPDSFSIELRSLLTGLLQRDVHKRLGCRGRGADEIKSNPFFRGIDWRVVYLQRLNPPLIPARGEVNAADAFDIGSFDDEDTKHIKLTDADQELYRNFPVVVSERWQHEIAETIFDYINHEADKAEMKRKSKHKLGYQGEEEQSDCILHGYIKRLGGTFTATWLTRYVRLYPNRLELWSDSGKQPELIFMDQIEEVCNDFVQIKNEQCIVIKLYNHSKYVLTNSDEIGLKEWHVSLKAAHRESMDMMTTMAEKATKIYGTEIPLKHMGKRRRQLQLQEATNAATNAAMSSSTDAPVSVGGGGAGGGIISGVATNWEQKIIQKELEVSSSSAAAAAKLKQQQVAAAAAAAAVISRGASKDDAEAMTKQQPDATSSMQVESSAPVPINDENQPTRAHHRSHRAHHHHHHHRHHHHHHHQHQQQQQQQQQAPAGKPADQLPATTTGRAQQQPVKTTSGGSGAGQQGRAHAHAHHAHHHHHHHGHRSRAAGGPEATAAAAGGDSPAGGLAKRTELSTGTTTDETAPAGSSLATKDTKMANNDETTAIIDANANMKPSDNKQPAPQEVGVKVDGQADQAGQQQVASDHTNETEKARGDIHGAAAAKQREVLQVNNDDDDDDKQHKLNVAQPGDSSSGDQLVAAQQQRIPNATSSLANSTASNSDEVASGSGSSGSSCTSSAQSVDDDNDDDEDDADADAIGHDDSDTKLPLAAPASGLTSAAVVVAVAVASENDVKVHLTEASVSSSSSSATAAAATTNLGGVLQKSISVQPTNAGAAMVANQQPPELPRVKLAVSLENVSENQQEVLRDPSKRITSDNKQREQDLVAQYEKLNINARNSSSSIEDETNFVASQN